LHWAEVLAKRVIEEKRGQFTFVVASAITTSGPTHMGTIMEFLMPGTISKLLNKMGYNIDFIFIADIMDAFDSIPQGLERFEWLKLDLGKPLYRVKDPFACHESYGLHYMNEAKEYMEKFDTLPDEIIPVNKLYEEGWYDSYLILFYEKIDEVREIFERTAMRELPKNWKDIVKPICRRCGRIDLTSLIKIESNMIYYYCSNCRLEDKMDISTHEWKLAWRLDWPTRQDFLGVDIEGGGVDHFTKGGSWDTAVEIHRKIFGKEPPIGFKYGFVMMDGKKMSKSKGIGSLNTLMRYLHPVVIKYFLLKSDLEENRNFKLNPNFLLSLYDEFYRVAKGELKDEKMRTALELSGKLDIKVPITDLIIYYQLYENEETILRLRPELKEEISELGRFCKFLISDKMIPEEYILKGESLVPPPESLIFLKEFERRLDSGMSDEDIHNLVYKTAQDLSIDPKIAFKWLYLAILGKERGPRAGKLILIMGVEKVKKALREAIKMIERI
jgi:lysyl-tRNA synthetase class 1